MKEEQWENNNFNNIINMLINILNNYIIIDGDD